MPLPDLTVTSLGKRTAMCGACLASSPLVEGADGRKPGPGSDPSEMSGSRPPNPAPLAFTT